MTNSEKYLKDGVDIKQMATEMVDYFNFPPYEGIGESNIEEFFEEQTKPTLTEDERVILRNIQYVEKIRKTELGDIVLCFKSGYQYHIRWLKPELFQFIKERRRI